MPEHVHDAPLLPGFVRECEVGPFQVIDGDQKLVVICEVLDRMGYTLK
jgi:hypothetical protein